MASRYWVGSGTWNATNTANWSTTSGGTGGASVPTSVDIVYFNASSGSNNTVEAGYDAACASINMTGYTGKLVCGTGASISIYGSGTSTIVDAFSQSTFDFIFRQTSTTAHTVSITNGTYIRSINKAGSGTGTVTISSPSSVLVTIDNIVTNTTANTISLGIIGTVTSYGTWNISNQAFTFGAPAISHYGTVNISSTCTGLTFTDTGLTRYFDNFNNLGGMSTLLFRNLTTITNYVQNTSVFCSTSAGNSTSIVTFSYASITNGSLSSNTNGLRSTKITLVNDAGVIISGATNYTAIEEIDVQATPGGTSYVSLAAGGALTSVVTLQNSNCSIRTASGAASSVSLYGTYYAYGEIRKSGTAGGNIYFINADVYTNEQSYITGSSSNNVTFRSGKITATGSTTLNSYVYLDNVFDGTVLQPHNFIECQNGASITFASRLYVPSHLLKLKNAYLNVTTLYTWGGSEAYRTLVMSLNGTSTINVTTYTVKPNYTDFYNISLTGTTLTSPTSVGDCGGNSGIPFNSPVTRYWVAPTTATNAFWGDTTTYWSTTSGGTGGASIPLAHDTAVFDTSGYYAACNVSARVPSQIQATGSNGNNISFNSNYNDYPVLFKSITTNAFPISGMGYLGPTASEKTLSFTNLGIMGPQFTVRSWSLIDTSSQSIWGLGGNWECYNEGSSWYFDNKVTFNTNNYNIIGLSFFDLTGAFAGNFGTSTISSHAIYVGSTYTANLNTADFQPPTNSTTGAGVAFLNSSSYLPKYTIPSTWTSQEDIVTFSGGEGGSVGTFTAKGFANTKTIKFASLGNPTFSFNKWDVSGTSSYRVVIRSTNSGSRGNINFTGSGVVSSDYLDIKDIKATPLTSTWYAGATSLNMGNNLGWIFTAAPSQGSNLFFGSNF